MLITRIEKDGTVKQITLPDPPKDDGIYGEQLRNEMLPVIVSAIVDTGVTQTAAITRLRAFHLANKP